MVEFWRDSLNMRELKPANIRISQGNIQNLAQLKQIMNAGLKLQYNSMQLAQ